MKEVQYIESFRHKHDNEIGIIIGGGTSLNGLLDKKFPFDRLQNNVMLGLNVAFKFITLDYLLFLDPYIYNKYHDSLKELSIPKITNLKFDDKRVKYPLTDIIQINSPTVMFPLINGDIKCNNAGSSGISLLHHFGIKKIYLFGFDLIVTNNNNKNFHTEYDDKKKGKNLAEANLKSFYENLKRIITLAKHKYKLDIISCSENSKLNTIIPYKNPFELLKL